MSQSHAKIEAEDSNRCHADKAKKYIGFHDTQYYDFNDMSGTQGIWPAIEEFLYSNRNWYIYEKFANNQGVTILKRKY